MGPQDAEFADLIGAIYDAVIEPNLWERALERLRARFDFRLAILGVNALPRGNAVIQAAANAPPDYLARMPGYTAEIVELWGGPAAMAAMPLEEPVLNSSRTSMDVWQDNRFYLEWARPLGIVDQVGMFIARDGAVFGSLGLSIHSSRRPVTDEDMDELRLLAPHLRRAVTISRMLDIAVDTAVVLQAALEATTTGVVLVDAGLGIVHANAAAVAMLNRGDPIRGSGGRLLLREELLPGQLQRAVQAAALDEATLGRRGMAIPIRLLDGSAAAISVLPLERRKLRGAPAMAATAAVFIADPAEPPAMPADALRLLYELTPAEQRVFKLVVDGRPTAEIARSLGVSVGTVRTQLLQVFQKTGRRDRADLVRLSHELTPPG